MQRVHRAEAQALDVVAFEDVQHLGDVHARCRGRRRADDLPVAIAAADRRALDHAVVGEVLRARRSRRPSPCTRPAGRPADRHAAPSRPAGRSGSAPRHSRACTSRVPAFNGAPSGSRRRRGQLVLQKIGGGAVDAVGQVRRHREAAGGVPDRGLHDVGERHRAVAAQGQAPGQQRARRGDRLRARPGSRGPRRRRPPARRRATGRYMSGRPASGTALMPSMTVWLPSARRIWQVVPPIRPTIIGSTTVSANCAATAASTALPPAASISMPAAEPSGWLVTTTPLRAMRRLLLTCEERTGALPPTRLAHVSRSFP